MSKSLRGSMDEKVFTGGGDHKSNHSLEENIVGNSKGTKSPVYVAIGAQTAAMDIRTNGI